jgi:2-succinyl-6-hydroxy-2,4-cyclohexadiene-1-carboxylate synthase
VGDLDQKFWAIAQQMQEKIPTARLAVVPSAGHTVHLERPQQFNTLVNDFIA